ncbi:MAG TPA: RHS repeat-associated core domain-containing protein [Bacteroidales bacterium]|nr:RHS repeat-associated core domain-containing protein [Bacteroidales bacterium]
MYYKIKYIKCFTIFIAAVLFSNDIYSQSCNTITIDQHYSGAQNRNDVSKQQVIFSNTGNGSGYNPAQGYTMEASIDPFIICDVDPIPEYNETSNPYIHNQSLPVGTIPGTAGVSNTGAATYNIPIFCPPGTNGMQPQISINYTSQGSNGLLGHGWSLSGLSSICLDNNEIYLDGYSESIKFVASSSNRYVKQYSLDGNRLILINASSNEYRTEVESFNKVIFENDSFIVYSKNGTISYYGTDENSRLKPITGETISWLLNKVVDKNGNYIRIQYYDNLSMEKPVKSISYTGNENSGLTPYNSIEFYYADKVDKQEIMINNVQINHTVVLEEIAVKHENVKVKMYQFKYCNQGITKLSEITEFGRNGEQLNSTVVEWGEENNSLYFPNNDIITSVNIDGCQLYQGSCEGGVYSNIPYVGDFNGDGIYDFANIYYCYNNNYECKTLKAFAGNIDGSFTYLDEIQIYYDIIDPMDPLAVDRNSVQVGDFNNNGKDGFIIGEESSNIDPTWDYVYYEFEENSNSFLSIPSYSMTNTQKRTYNFGNYYGNGRNSYLEKVYAPMFTASYINYFTSSNSLNSFMINNPFDSKLLDFTINDISFYRNNHSANIDFDGDGITDIIGVFSVGQTDMVNIYEFNSSTNEFDLLHYVPSNYIAPNDLINNNENFKFADFNGDGKTDFIKLNESTDNWDLFISNGNYFLTPISDIFSSTYNTSNNYKLYAIDMNGDGLTDLVECKVINDNGNIDSYLKIHYNIGSAEFISYETQLNIADIGLFELSFGDFNGDGNTDIIYYDNDGNYRVAYVLKDDRQKFVTCITDGMNVKNKFYYHSLLDNPTFNCSVQIDGPIIPLKSPLYVTYKHKQSSGLNNEWTEKVYSYKDGKIHVQGKGFLGFEEILELDSISEFKTVIQNQLNQNYMINQKTIDYYDISTPGIDNPIKHIVNTNLIKDMDASINPNWIAVMPQSSSITNYLNGTFTNKSYSYYNENSGVFLGNIESETTNYSNQITETIEYNNYSALGSWCLNKPEEVISTRQESNKPQFKLENTFTYNIKGEIISSISDSYPNSGGKSLTMTYTYDDFGNVLSETVSGNSITNGNQNRTISYEYDSKGRFVTKETDVLGLSILRKYDFCFGNILSEKDVRGNTTTFKYDSFGNLIQIISPLGNITTIDKEWTSNFQDCFAYSVNKQSPNEPEIIVWYDILGREVKSQTNLYDKSITTEKQYLVDGRIDKESLPYETGTAPMNWNEYSYYPKYKRLESVTSLGLTTSYSYSNNEIEIDYPDGSTYTKEFNAIGQVVSNDHESEGSVSFNYHSNGQVESITANGATITNQYDEYGNQTALQDPDAGTVTYEYNAFGELVNQEDANQNEFEMIYDNAGRLTTKTCTNDSDYTIYYSYYASGNSNGLLQSEQMGNGVAMSYEYDEYGRPVKKHETISGNVYTHTYSYDDYGNLEYYTYPSGYKIRNEYDSHGYFTGVFNNTNERIWELSGSNTVNIMGQFLSYKSGPNGIVTSFDYGADFDLEEIQTGNIFEYNYNFDHASGNLLYREDHLNQLQEQFAYDDLNRLVSWQINGQTALTADYTTNGNIELKSDIGTYDYDQNKVHAVSEITSVTNSPINSCMQSITYCPLLKASNIIEGIEGIDDYSLSLKYGPDNKRKESKFYENETLTLTKYYSGLYEKTIDDIGVTKEFHLIYGGDGMAAVHIITNGDNENADTYYMAKDHLGSVMNLFDENENIIEEHSYDAWGNLRNVQNWSFTNVNTNFIYNRGYTGHEMLSNFGLINMNGRIYDPQIGRMLSPDNYVQETYNSQNYNRYTYCLNNPLKYTDPSGNLFKPPFLFRLLGEAADWAGNSLSGSTQTFDMNYAISGNMSNTWQNNPNVLLGFNGYPIGPNGQSYNPYGGLGNDKHWSVELYNKLPRIATYCFEPVYCGAYISVGLGSAETEDVQDGEGVLYYRLKKRSAAANGGGMGEYVGVGGFGISLEFAVPKWLLIRKGDYAGVGIDVGVLRDKNGLGFYATTKTTLESGVAASIQFEGFGASRRNYNTNPIDRMVLIGPGYETSLGIGPVGGSYSTDNSADYGRMPLYHMFTYSLGLGIDAGYVNWNTNTYVSKKRKF